MLLWYFFPGLDHLRVCHDQAGWKKAQAFLLNSYSHLFVCGQADHTPWYSSVLFIILDMCPCPVLIGTCMYTYDFFIN